MKTQPVTCEIDLDPILKLPVTQRLLIAKRIKDSTKEKPIVVHPEVWAEIMRRSAALDADPSRGIPYEQIKQELKGRKTQRKRKRA